MTKQNILLVEPGYPNKYPPLGLMKIAAYHGPRGRGDNVLFVKGDTREVLGQVWDRVYVTTLFSFEWKRTAAAIDFALRSARGQSERVFVGGIAATLMFDEFIQEPRWAGVRFIKGLLDQPPARSLHLSTDDGDFGAHDVVGTPIEELVPDYSILGHVPYAYPVQDAYFGYASRGCIRKCSFCGVPKLEGGQREMPPITGLVVGVDEQFGPRKDLILMDNNVVASSRYREVIAEIRDLGFHRGAVFERPDSRPVKRRVDFNQGVDARILAKTPMYLKEMSTICIDPLRIAFDHVGMRRVYERSVEMAADLRTEVAFELHALQLHGHAERPLPAHEHQHRAQRAARRPNLVLPDALPARHDEGSVSSSARTGIATTLRSFQIMLQATHGVVSGSNEFFLRAFGSSYDEFERLLSLPHAFIFHRDFYEFGKGRPVLDEYNALRRRLNTTQQGELIGLLSAALLERPQREAFLRLVSDKSLSHFIRQLAPFHAIDTKAPKVTDIAQVFPELTPDQMLPEPEALVEDAGLYESLDEPPAVDLMSSQSVGPRRHPMITDPIVGGDLLRLITAGMYANPLVLYREYLQNAADAIASQGRGAVHVKIDRLQAQVTIVERRDRPVTQRGGPPPHRHWTQYKRPHDRPRFPRNRPTVRPRLRRAG